MHITRRLFQNAVPSQLTFVCVVIAVEVIHEWGSVGQALEDTVEVTVVVIVPQTDTNATTMLPLELDFLW